MDIMNLLTLIEVYLSFKFQDTLKDADTKVRLLLTILLLTYTLHKHTMGGGARREGSLFSD